MGSEGKQRREEGEGDGVCEGEWLTVFEGWLR